LPNTSPGCACGVTVYTVGARFELGILGPFQVCVDRGVPTALGGLRQRAVLAVLALRANEVVSTDRLVDELWGESAPAKAAHTVQVFVSRLRSALGPAGERLVTRPPGYVLELEMNELDSARCEQLYETARSDLNAGDAASAAALLGEAQALWRGPPLAEFTYEPFAQATVARLEELRLNCREELIEAQLALGLHTEVVSELEALIREQPLRERPRSQLMLALYRCGRQAEALEEFQRARRMLVENLGIEPGLALRELEQAILQQDRSLTVAATEKVRRGAVGSSTSDGPAATAASAVQAHNQAPDLTSDDMRSATVPPRTATGAFVGRADCLERLRYRWRESKAGRTNLVWLVGEAGIGKTRLAMQFADEARRDGGLALYGRADLESVLPYQPLAETLDVLMAHAGTRLVVLLEHDLETLSRPFPNLRRYTRASAVLDDPDDLDTMRYEVFEAVVSVLVRASAETPLMVVLDDLQWADQPTLLLLRHLLRRAEGARLLVVGTFRSEEPNQRLAGLLADLRRERLYDRVKLEGLDEEAIRKLVADRAGIETTAAFISRLQTQTDGNPFFIEETLRALTESGVTDGMRVDQDALETLGVPEGVAEVITRRVEQLSPMAQQLLVVASVVGASFSLRLVEDVMRSERRDTDRELDAAPVDAIAAAADEALIAGLALELPAQFEVLTFSHALVREVLYASLTGGRRVRLHNLVARALERVSGHAAINPVELAHHFMEARPVAGPEPARRYAIAAGRRATEQFAYEEAAQHLRRALALFDEDDEAARCDVLLTLGRVQWRMGDERARSTFLAAAESAERRRAAEGRRAAEQLARSAIGLAERYFEITYHGARYLDWLEKARDALPPDDNDPRARQLRVSVLSRLAVNLAYPYEEEDCLALSAEALAIARGIGDARTLATALIARHHTLVDVRHIEERLALDDELRILGGVPLELAADRHHWRMYDLLGIGDLDAARREFVELDRLAGKLDQPVLRSVAFGARGLWAELAGDAEETERWADESLRYAKIAHTHDAMSSWGSQVFALRRRQGRIAELASLTEEIADPGRPLGWLSALGVLRLETGDEPAARAIYEDEMRAGPANLPRGMFWLTRMALLSELCAGLGDAAGAAKLYVELLPHAGRNVVVAYCSFWGPVDGYLALLAETLGHKTLARQHADAALVRAIAMDAPVIVEELQRRRARMRLAG